MMGAPTTETTPAAAPPPTRGRGRSRGARAIPWAVLALWIAVLALAGPLAGKLADAQQNRAFRYGIGGGTDRFTGRLTDPHAAGSAGPATRPARAAPRSRR